MPHALERAGSRGDKGDNGVKFVNSQLLILNSSQRYTHTLSGVRHILLDSFERTPSKSKIIDGDSFAKNSVTRKTGERACAVGTFAYGHSSKKISNNSHKTSNY
ncbi:MAG: hypothetical protein ACRAVC_07830 [Trichormus sp.]